MGGTSSTSRGVSFFCGVMWYKAAEEYARGINYCMAVQLNDACTYPFYPIIPTLPTCYTKNRRVLTITNFSLLIFFLTFVRKYQIMADNYLEKKMEDFMQAQPAKRRVVTLRRLLQHNRSYRGYDASFKVREDQLRRIIEVVTLCPSARNQQVLRFRPVMGDEAASMLKYIRLGGALPELHLPFAGSEPNAFIVICSSVEESKYVDIDLGIAAQSMLLQAVEIGLGGICIGAFDHEPLKELLGLKYEPLLVLAIGRPAERIELKECGEGDNLTYYREGGVHYVPKIRVDDLIIK